MRLAYESAAVRVPATTANMGPGFDSFGMAFRYYDEVEVRPVTGPTRVEIEGVGAGTVPTDDDNLVVRALRDGLEAVGAPQAGFEMRCVNRIPHGGGMGSSASAAVAGLMLARGLLSEPQALSDDEVFLIATRFEGHPDNVAPAVFGGATVAWVERGGHPRMAPMPVDASLGVSLLIPPSTTRLSTKEARQVLPVSVPREDALFNTSRAAVLMLALAGRPDLLMADEPTGALDLDSSGVVLDWLRRLASQGTTVVMVTHDVEAAALADSVAVMSGGRLATWSSCRDAQRIAELVHAARAR